MITILKIAPEAIESNQFAKVKQKVIDIIASDDVIFASCDYSYRHLLETIDYLNNILLKKVTLNAKASAVANNFNVCDVDTIKNRVVVYLHNYNNKNIQTFKTDLLNQQCIVFTESDIDAEPAATFDPGTQISYSGSRSSSWAYRVKRNGVSGFMTCAHNKTTTSGSNWIEYDGVTVANCTVKQYSGSVDAAFCKITNSNYTPTNKIFATGTLYLTCKTPAVGDFVYKRGFISGLTSGNVTSINYSWNSDGVQLTSQIKAMCTTMGGDSGGIMHTFDHENLRGYPLGIISGRATDNTYGIASKATLSNSALGVTRY